MRGIVLAAAALIAALCVAFAKQVLVSQAGESGAFFDRVSAVLDRQFGTAKPAAVVAAAPSPRSDGGLAPAAPIPPELAAVSKLTAEQYAALTRSELSAMKADLIRDAEDRDRDGFWMDVRLNALFLVLGLVFPMMLARMSGGRR